MTLRTKQADLDQFLAAHRPGWTVHKAVPLGDRHHYVTLHELAVRAGAVEAGYAHVVWRDSQCVEQPARVRGSLSAVRPVDHLSGLWRDLLQYAAPPADAYEDATTGFVVQDAAGQQRGTVVRKCGRATAMEQVGQEFLRRVGYSAVTYCQGTPGWSVWCDYVPGRRSLDLLSGLSSGQLDETACPNFPETMAQLGRLSVLMWVIGHHDCHGENIIIPHDLARHGAAQIIDCETLGSELFERDPRTDEPVSRGLFRLLVQIMTTAHTDPQGVVTLPRFSRQAARAFADGAQAGMAQCVMQSDDILHAMDASLGAAPAPLVTRLVVLPTRFYDRTKPVPHYSIAFGKEDYLAAIQHRLTALVEAVEYGGLRVQYCPRTVLSLHAFRRHEHLHVHGTAPHARRVALTSRPTWRGAIRVGVAECGRVLANMASLRAGPAAPALARFLAERAAGREASLATPTER